MSADLLEVVDQAAEGYEKHHEEKMGQQQERDDPFKRRPGAAKGL